MNFEFATANQILFGLGRLREAVPLIAALGRRSLVVTGFSSDRCAHFRDQLSALGLENVPFGVTSEPEIATVQEGLRCAHDARCDMVISLGGGSALDAGKAIAAILANGGEPLDYLEVIGRGLPLARPSVPFVAIPTTAGTGSEVTRNAVLGSPEHRVKVSLRSPHMLPSLAVVDPELTCSAPPPVTASTGLDALTQLIEPYLGLRANPMTDAFSREGMRRVARSLERAFVDGNDAEAREDMAFASLLGGLALSNASLGAVHGLAGPLGGMFPAPHGAVCARLLPVVLEANLRALQARMPKSPALERLDEMARILTGHGNATAADGIAWIHSLCESLAIAPLARHGLSEAAFPALIAQAQKANSMKGNPIPLTERELTGILERAL